MRALATNLKADKGRVGARVQRRALIVLEPDHQHRVTIELGLVQVTLGVAAARALAEALAACSAEVAMTLLGTFAPGFSADDFPALCTALEEFEDDVAAEENRPTPRWYPSSPRRVVL